MTSSPVTYGANPVNIKWNVVRGDTAVLLVEFYQNDEETAFDTTGWDYRSTAFDPETENFDDLEIESGDGYVQITAPDYITETWGSGIRSRVTELKFDLEVTTNTGEIWTAVVGSISVLGDVTGGTL